MYPWMWFIVSLWALITLDNIGTNVCSSFGRGGSAVKTAGKRLGE
jgi:hypothetical protein